MSLFVVETLIIDFIASDSQTATNNRQLSKVNVESVLFIIIIRKLYSYLLVDFPHGRLLFNFSIVPAFVDLGSFPLEKIKQDWF